MHEFSISDEIVKNVLRASRENNGKKVLSIQLEIGELALLNVEQVTFWIQELSKGSVAEGAKVKVRRIKARIKCQSCGYRGGMNLDQSDPFRHAVPYSCPRCQSFQIDVEKGRECHLKKIQALR